MNDLALIAIAASALTAAVLLVAFHVYSGARRRQLARVRAQRDAARTEARRLRADRVQPFAAHAARAVALTEPIPYRLASPTAYMPVLEGDNPAVREYASLADAIRPFRRGAVA